MSDRVGTSNSIDPMLGPLADNGGGSQTRILLAGSPAIDAGNNDVGLPNGPYYDLSCDQRRRYSRHAGDRIDIGAFELNATQRGVLPFSFRMPLVGSDKSGAFYANSPVVITEVVTGQKRYAMVTLTGDVTFWNVDYNVTSVIEVVSKRPFRWAVKVFPN